jgi:polyadenylation factor subunit 2
VRLWDPREARQLATLHGHKNTVLDLKWNMNGNWLLTCGKDQLIKLYDIRKLEELFIFKGHKKDITSLAWHPSVESMFVSGGFEGSLYFWYVGQADTSVNQQQQQQPQFSDVTFGSESTEGKICTPMSAMDQAHEGAIWSLDWHPIGHILVSGSNDHSTRFWTRARPCDLLDEKENRLISTSTLGLSPDILPPAPPPSHYPADGRHPPRPVLSVPSHFQQSKRKRDMES